MSKKVKRTISLIIAAIMLLSTMSVLAFADNLPTYGAVTAKECGPHDCVPARESDGTPKWKEDKTQYVEPTCVKAGKRVIVLTCDICGKLLEERVELLPKTDSHVPAACKTIENVKQPTCKNFGSYDEVTRCKLCNKVLETKTYKVEKLSTHVAAAPVKENCVPATCIAAGSYDSVIYCTICKKELQRTFNVIPKTGYHMSMFKNPGKVYSNEYGYTRTCADGEDKCLVCGELLNPAIPHIWDKGVVTTPATLTSTGIVTYTCLVCGTTNMKTIPALKPAKGDVDGDGAVTTADARLILRFAVGLGNFDKVITGDLTFNAADIDNDCVVLPADARLALRLAVGLRIDP